MGHGDCRCALSVSASTVRLGQDRLSGMLESDAVRGSGQHHIIRDETASRKIIVGGVLSQKRGHFTIHLVGRENVQILLANSKSFSFSVLMFR